MCFLLQIFLIILVEARADPGDPCGPVSGLCHSPGPALQASEPLPLGHESLHHLPPPNAYLLCLRLRGRFWGTSNRACGLPASEAPSLPSFQPLGIRFFPPQEALHCLDAVRPAAQRGEGQAGLLIPLWCAGKGVGAAKHPAAQSWHPLHEGLRLGRHQKPRGEQTRGRCPAWSSQ